ncbi:hypothetical protein SKAU_G00304260 [Synaphobranchus kaupii]|uniref:Uncharacterized protein n=1 Tax=Synaphobranchus kaupii TaxID=118154 RepID=A0A9Q1EWA5_SYNKA|nr:hypothetical protein SKAU_G00304260 [Synaphobranchus kaupii]
MQWVTQLLLFSKWKRLLKKRILARRQSVQSISSAGIRHAAATPPHGAVYSLEFPWGQEKKQKLGLKAGLWAGLCSWLRGRRGDTTAAKFHPHISMKTQDYFTSQELYKTQRVPKEFPKCQLSAKRPTAHLRLAN